MRAKNIYWVILCAWSLGGFAQNKIIEGPEDSWFGEHKILISAQNERYDLVQLHLPDQNKITVRKSSATEVVEKSISSGQSSQIELQDAVIDPENGLYLLLKNSNHQIFAMKLDDNLNIVWQLDLVELEGMDTYFKNKIMLSGDEHLLISISLYDQHLAIKIVRAGNVIWKKQYGAVDCVKCPGFDMIPLEDGAILSIKIGLDAAIYRIDGEGNVLWSKTLMDGVYRHPRAIYVINEQIYVFCVSNNNDAQMLILSLDGDLLNGFFYGFGPTYYVNIQYYIDHFYFQNTYINPPNGEAYNSIVVMNQNLNTVAAFLANELYLNDNTSGVDLNRTGGEILLALNQNTGYSFSVVDMAENECLQPYVASDLFMSISNLNNLDQHFISGLVTQTDIPNENNAIVPIIVENSEELTYSIGCAENTNLSTETFDWTVNIFPNPAQNVVYLSDPEIFAEVHFIDFLGRVVKSVATPTNEIHTNDLQCGYYVMQLHLKNGSLYTEKITILR